MTSPSRATITLSKSLTEVGSGYYSITLSSSDTGQLVDDTYAYYLRQADELVKHGRVRLLVPEVSEELVFDYTLDFTLS